MHFALNRFRSKNSMVREIWVRVGISARGVVWIRVRRSVKDEAFNNVIGVLGSVILLTRSFELHSSCMN